MSSTIVARHAIRTEDAQTLSAIVLASIVHADDLSVTIALAGPSS